MLQFPKAPPWLYTVPTMQPNDGICNISIYTNYTVYSKCDKTSDLLQQLEFTFELESDIRETLDWSRKCLINFKKTMVLLFLK